MALVSDSHAVLNADSWLHDKPKEPDMLRGGTGKPLGH